MAKRRLAVVAFVLAGIMLAGVALAADDNPTVKWNCASAWDTNNPLLKSDQYIAEKVEKITSGKFSIKVYVAGAMVPAYEVFDAVSSGAFPMGSTALSYQAGINPAFSLYTSIPLLMSQQDYFNWLYQADGLKLLNEILEKYNIVAFPNTIFDLESGFRSHKEVKRLEDFKGMKMRVGTLELQAILQKLGVAFVSLSGGELYDAMQRGIIDAFEYMTPNIDWDMGFHEIAEYWVAPAWYQTAVCYYTLINADAWKKLPENYRAILEEVTKASVIEWSSFMNVQSAMGTKKFLDYGVKVSRAGEGDETFWPRMEALAKESLEELASKNSDYARVLKSQMDYLKTYTLWKEITSPFHSGIVAENLPEVKDEWLKK